jgi:arabinogalactan endo-1,4-beta-galactosidase
LFAHVQKNDNPEFDPVQTDTVLFISGADLSLVPKIEKSGIQFYDFSNEADDILTILKKQWTEYCSGKAMALT